jgi:hypothetical protein
MIRHLRRCGHNAGLLLTLAFAATWRPSAVLAQDADLGPLKATREHPLFSPMRRAVERPPAQALEMAAAKVAQSSKPNLELRGVVYAENRRIAIVKHPQEARTIEVSEGAEIDGWTIVAIQHRAIALRRDTLDLVLKMSEPK